MDTYNCDISVTAEGLYFWEWVDPRWTMAAFKLQEVEDGTSLGLTPSSKDTVHRNPGRVRRARTVKWNALLLPGSIDLHYLERY